MARSALVRIHGKSLGRMLARLLVALDLLYLGVPNA
ncbi:MAG: hypothetical protein K0Q76_1710 [Panacagrimonas sp.]|jgi:hypothetical protein|nr:hypothetical protein [Panacagrimonas sp.]